MLVQGVWLPIKSTRDLRRYCDFRCSLVRLAYIRSMRGATKFLQAQDQTIINHIQHRAHTPLKTRAAPCRDGLLDVKTPKPWGVSLTTKPPYVHLYDSPKKTYLQTPNPNKKPCWPCNWVGSSSLYNPINPKPALYQPQAPLREPYLYPLQTAPKCQALLEGTCLPTSSARFSASISAAFRAVEGEACASLGPEGANKGLGFAVKGLIQVSCHNMDMYLQPSWSR